MSARLSGVRELVADFDVFLVDQFGVLHDGRAAFPGAAEALAGLKAAGKAVALLSNSGRRAAYNARRIAGLGIGPELYDLFVCSGEVAWTMIREGTVVGVGPGAACLLLSRDGDRGPVEGLGLRLVTRAEDADFVLLAGATPESLSLQDYARRLAPAAARGAPCLCTNPDLRMYTAEGPRFGTGRVADVYEQLGGPVTRIGKPYPEIYRHALATLRVPDRRRVAAIGDSPHHDVKGARDAGLAPVLVTSGLYAGEPSDGLPLDVRLLERMRW